MAWFLGSQTDSRPAGQAHPDLTSPRSRSPTEGGAPDYARKTLGMDEPEQRARRVARRLIPSDCSTQHRRDRRFCWSSDAGRSSTGARRSLVEQAEATALIGPNLTIGAAGPYPWLAIWIRFPHVSSNTAVVTDSISSGSCVNCTPNPRSRSYSACTSLTANDV
jgi:hypothetical protein